MSGDDQFKFGDQSLVGKIIDKNTLVYEGRVIKYGLPNCKCSAYDIKIRDCFDCTSCSKLHAYKCSSQDEGVLIANDYFMSGTSLCAVCEKK